MKRRLSLLLAVVMILGSFSFAFAAEETAEEKAGAFLMKVGVLEGINGELKLEDNLRRQDAVVLVARLHGAEDEAKKFPTDDLKFTDFKDPFYRPIIAWAVANDLVEGHTPERFGFNEDVTAQQYATILLRALGYNDDVAGKDGYAKALELAKKLGVLENAEVENDTAITRGQMAVMTFNALGTKMKDSDKTLADKLGIKMPEPAELKVEDVRSENLKEVVVELSNAKLADKAKLEDVNNYKVVGFKFEEAIVDGNSVILLLEGKDTQLAKGRGYELVIANIDKDVNGTYKFTAEDNTIPAVDKVEVLGEYGIKVTTTEPVKNPRERNFLIDGKNVAMKLEQYGRTLILTPYYGKEFPANAEKLTVKGLEDYAGYKSIEEDFDIEIVKDEVAPEVVDVVVKGNVVEVTFDKDIYMNSVFGYRNRNTTGNVSYKDGRHTIYTVQNGGEKIAINKARYTFDEELPRRPEITISGVANHSNVKMKEVTVEGREVVDYSEPVIIDTWKGAYDREDKEDAGLTIRLYFDKDVTGYVEKDQEKAEDLRFVAKDHFDIYEREVHRKNKITKADKDGDNFDDYFESVKYFVDKNGKVRKDIIDIRLKGLNVNNRDKDYDYVLEVRNFASATNTRNKMYRDYVDFDIPEKSTDFEIKDVYVGPYRAGRDTEISLEFSLPVDRVRAENPQAYLFDGAYDVQQLGGDIVVEENGYVVTLLIPDFDPADWSKLEVLPTLRDAFYGNRLGGATIYDFATKTLLKAGQTPDERAAEIVEDLIDAIPAVDELTLKDEGTVSKARKAYDALTKAQKDLVTNLEKLEDAEDRIQGLKDESQTLDDAVKAVKSALAEFEATNSTTDADVLAAVKAVVTNKDITPVIDGALSIVKADETKGGKITGKINLTFVDDETTVTKTVDVDLVIPMLEQTLEQAETAVKGVVSGEDALKVTNATTEADVLAAVKEVVTNKDIEVKIVNFNKKEATTEAAGSITGDVQLTLKGNVKLVNFNLTIDTLTE